MALMVIVLTGSLQSEFVGNSLLSILSVFTDIYFLQVIAQRSVRRSGADRQDGA